LKHLQKCLGIPTQRILIIEPTGKVCTAARFGFETNYNSMTRDNVVDWYFPPLPVLRRSESNNEEELEETSKFLRPSTCSSYTYWRSQADDIDQGELEAYERNRRKKQLEEVKRKNALVGRNRFFSE
jgi:hypothetical protein